MPALLGRLRDGGPHAGGIRGYPLERVYQEVAQLGRHVHWTHTEVMSFDHAERRRWLRAVLAQAERD
ncbi:DUF6760 family protein [Nonomuraea sp. NPDC046802]|uniref:DUF6760 family protein n=1 Tax=Nonomuraea sp. NPDC046802 TaxID=3154919 RepID=UPI0033DAE555